MSIFEVRTYHFEPTKFDEFKVWAKTQTVPYVKSKMSVVGYWINNEMDPIHGGKLSRDETSSQANVTWIIRWDDRAQREQVWDEIKADPEWKTIFSQVPGGRGGFLRTEYRFATEL